MQIIIETSGGSTLETDVLQLVADHWRDIGVALFVRASQRDIFRSRAMAGEVMMSVWGGLDNGVPTADMSPAALAPTADDQLQWPLWGMYYYSSGTGGKPPDLPVAKRSAAISTSAGAETSDPELHARASGGEMLQIHADQVFSIGIVNGSLQPVVNARAAAQRAGQGALRVRADLVSRASTCPIPSGTTGTPEHAALHPLARRR